MRERRRSTIPSTTLKRAAADWFRGYDSDATDSTTESESETERLERYPAKRRPSPRKTSGRMREQLRAARLRASGEEAQKAEMEDEGRALAIRTQRRIVEKPGPVKLGMMPRVLDEAPGVEDEDGKPGSGQVFLDVEEGRRKCDAVMRARRTVVRQTETNDDLSDLPKSDMGLFASLPGELRNRIYRLALVEGDGKPFLISMEKNTCNLGACIHMRMATAVFGILSACKQIRAEATPIFIAENSFKFDDELVKARCIANWLRIIGPYGNLLSKVVLDIVCWEVPAGRRATSSEKVGIHYEIALRWKPGQCHGRWSLHMDREIVLNATTECSVLDSYVDTLNRSIVNEGKVKEVALRDFVWSDWLAKLVYTCRK